MSGGAGVQRRSEREIIKLFFSDEIIRKRNKKQTTTTDLRTTPRNYVQPVSCR